MQGYRRYRSYGHTRWVAFWLGIPFWWCVVLFPVLLNLVTWSLIAWSF